LIYRGNRITNWCPRDRSAISDLEVNYEEVDGKLYGVRYPFADGGGPGPDGNDYAQVFTTRPETVLGDVALVVNPKMSGTRTSSDVGSRCPSWSARSR
jgi:valyl-tRNA synthetase